MREDALRLDTNALAAFGERFVESNRAEGIVFPPTGCLGVVLNPKHPPSDRIPTFDRGPIEFLHQLEDRVQQLKDRPQLTSGGQEQPTCYCEVAGAVDVLTLADCSIYELSTRETKSVERGYDYFRLKEPPPNGHRYFALHGVASRNLSRRLLAVAPLPLGETLKVSQPDGVDWWAVADTGLLVEWNGQELAVEIPETDTVTRDFLSRLREAERSLLDENLDQAAETLRRLEAEYPTDVYAVRHVVRDILREDQPEAILREIRHRAESICDHYALKAAVKHAPWTRHFSSRLKDMSLPLDYDAGLHNRTYWTGWSPETTPDQVPRDPHSRRILDQLAAHGDLLPEEVAGFDETSRAMLRALECLGFVRRDERRGDYWLTTKGYAAVRLFDQEGQVISANSLRDGQPDRQYFGKVREIAQGEVRIEFTVQDHEETWTFPKEALRGINRLQEGAAVVFRYYQRGNHAESFLDPA